MSLEAVAIAGVILGVVLLSTRFSEIRGYVRGKGVPSIVGGAEWAAVAAVSFGVVYVGVGYATPFLGYFLPVFIMRGVGAGIGFVAAPVFRANVKPNKESFSSIIFTMAVLEAVGLLSFNYGLTLGPNVIPVLAALSGMGGAVAASYALVLLKERLEKNQVIGAVLAIAGVFTLLYIAG